MKLYRLNDVCDVRDGTHDSPKYVQKGYPLVTSKNIVNGKLDLTNVNYITEEDYIKINQRSKVDDGDILMPMIGTIGNPIIVKKEYDFAIKNVALLKFNDNGRVIPKYIKYVLDSPLFKRYIEKENRGGTQKFLSLTNIRNFMLPVPTIDIQIKIVQILDKAQLLIDIRKAQIEALDQLTQSVFLEMFGDPGKNPKKWPFGTIQELTLKTQYGTSKKANENSGEFPILRMNNITYSGNWNFTDMKYIDLNVKESDKYLVYKGEVLFNRTNSKELVGKTAVYREEQPMAFAGYLVKLIPNEKANGEFISTYLNSKYGKAILLSMAKSIVGMANINAEELKGIKIYMPPRELQDRFTNVIIRILEQRELFLKGLSTLEENFNSLMQRAFKGELFTE